MLRGARTITVMDRPRPRSGRRDSRESPRRRGGLAMTRRSIFLLTMLIWPLGSRVTAAVANQAAPGAVELRGALVATHDAERQRALSESHAWQDFRARHGRWSAVWNEATSSPHLAFGEAIPLDGPTADAAQVDRAVRRFIG